MTLAIVQKLHYHSIHASTYPLFKLRNCEIAMFFGDHHPPHFHVLAREGAAQVRIDTLEVMNMSGKLDIREALDWAAANRDMLMTKWEEFSGDGV